LPAERFGRAPRPLSVTGTRPLPGDLPAMPQVSSQFDFIRTLAEPGGRNNVRGAGDPLMVTAGSCLLLISGPEPG